ncbi:MAG: hypothetical protein FWC64_00170 [Treponema sp.]|nr:hypothetical protein [Treponema sp.]
MSKTARPEKPDTSPKEGHIAWHPAFFEAIQMEFNEYRNTLQFLSEHQLTKEPLRIDVVVIKKAADVEIKKSIGAIFRGVNILEYKSPDDYVSVEDFYLVYSYACLYVSLYKTDIDDLTLTFVESRRPEKLIEHLTKKRNFTVEKNGHGIYIVKGDVLPIQIINNRELSTEESVWLKDLDNQLDARRVRRITDKIAGLGKDAQIWAYLDVIARANEEALQEAYEMSDTAIASLQRTFERIGFSTEWEVRGEARGMARGGEEKALEIAGNMLKSGFSVEQTAALSGLDVEKVTALSSI